MSAFGPQDETPVRFLRGVRLKHDVVRGRWVLLAPERAINLDAIGHAILSEVDGERPLRVIVETLAARYNAPVEQIAKDCRGFILGLVQRRMMEIAP